MSIDTNNDGQQTMTLGDLLDLLRTGGAWPFDIGDADLEIALGDRHYPVTCLMDDDADACLPDPVNRGATLLIHGSPSRTLAERQRQSQLDREQREAATNEALVRCDARYDELNNAAYRAVAEVLESWGIAVDTNGDTQVGAIVDEEFASDLAEWISYRVELLRDEMRWAGYTVEPPEHRGASHDERVVSQYLDHMQQIRKAHADARSLDYLRADPILARYLIDARWSDTVRFLVAELGIEPRMLDELNATDEVARTEYHEQLHSKDTCPPVA